LACRPGITSPASLAFIDEQDLLAQCSTPDRYYREVLLPRKLELDLFYCQHVSLLVDAQLIVRTALRLVVPPHFQRRRKILL
jgi:lipopolysaccharide/colanic/teichoic acid biosynthesis glycosyltransferase